MEWSSHTAKDFTISDSVTAECSATELRISVEQKELYCLSHCTLSLAAQCIVIGPVCVCGFVAAFMCLFVCGSVTTITRNFMH